MEIPKFHETFVPILEVLADEKAIHYKELCKTIIEKYYSHLPEDVLSTKTKSGDLLIFNRINWGKSYLKKSGYIHYPGRGIVQITQKGKDVDLKSINLKSVVDDSGLFDFYKDEKDKNIEDLKVRESSPQDLIDSGFSAIETQTKSDLLDKLKTADPFYFEKIILILLHKMGYGDFIETSKTGDGGIDGIINQDKLGIDKIYIQAKRYTDNKVREKDIRNFIGAMSGDTLKGVFVTTSCFDEAATRKASSANHTIILIDGPKLVDLLYQFGVGVYIKDVYEVKVIDDMFFEEN
jgi:restriction system protein